MVFKSKLKTVLFLALSILFLFPVSCNKDNLGQESETDLIQNELSEEAKKEFLSFLMGKWQVERGNSFREFEIYEPNFFHPVRQYPHTIKVVKKNEASLTPFDNDIRLGLYFKIIRKENSDEIVVYNYTDNTKTASEWSTYLKVDN